MQTIYRWSMCTLLLLRLRFSRISQSNSCSQTVFAPGIDQVLMNISALTEAVIDGVKGLLVQYTVSLWLLITLDDLWVGSCRLPREILDWQQFGNNSTCPEINWYRTGTLSHIYGIVKLQLSSLNLLTKVKNNASFFIVFLHVDTVNVFTPQGKCAPDSCDFNCVSAKFRLRRVHCHYKNWYN